MGCEKKKKTVHDRGFWSMQRCSLWSLSLSFCIRQAFFASILDSLLGRHVPHNLLGYFQELLKRQNFLPHGLCQIFIWYPLLTSLVGKKWEKRGQMLVMAKFQSDVQELTSLKKDGVTNSFGPSQRTNRRIPGLSQSKQRPPQEKGDNSCL